VRLRKNPALVEAIGAYREIVFLGGKTNDGLLGKRPLALELGTGRGSFLLALAQKEPASFFVGVDTRAEVLYYAARRIAAAGLTNAFLIEGNAAFVEDWFSPGQVERLYINFCDPWPKARHAKRRLVHRGFLSKYRKIMPPGGEIFFKTDNQGLFSFALEEFVSAGLIIKEKEQNLHGSQIANPAWTEYEQKFHRLGMPIAFCRAVWPAFNVGA
jgi:tRNA (guanine-N7-)-methyltransferase